MTRQTTIALGLLAGAGLIAFAMMRLRSEPEERDTATPPPLVQTVAIELATGPLLVRGAGTVEAAREVEITAQVTGPLVYVNPRLREGAAVERGETLFRIDPDDFENRLAGARADVAAQEVAVLQASEEVEIARAELRRFESREKARLTALDTLDADDYASRFLPPSGLESSPASPIEADGTSQLATREPQLRSAQAARMRAQAQLEDARLALDRTVVRAPFSGIVRSPRVALGTLVSPGQPVATLAALDSYEVRVSLTEGEAALIPGLWSDEPQVPATVYFTYGEMRYRWQAAVERAARIVDPGTRAVDVFLSVPDPASGTPAPLPQPKRAASSASSPLETPPLLIGSFVDVEIEGATPERYVAVPIRALRPDNEVWIARQGSLTIVAVHVIQRTDEIAYVRSERLRAGDRLVTSPLRAPVDGRDIRSAEEAPGRTASGAGEALDDD